MARRKLAFASDDLESIARYGLPDDLRFTPHSQADVIARLTGRIVGLRREFAEKFDEVDGNPHLSNAGKTAARQDLGKIYLQKLADLQADDGMKIPDVVLAGKAKAAKRQAELDGASKITDREAVAHAVRDTYLWDLLRQRDPLELPTLFGEAIENGDAEVYQAFVRAPKILKLLPAEVLAEGITGWNARVNPDAAREVGELETAVKLVASAYTDARYSIEDALGMPGADPLRVVAEDVPPSGQ